MMSILLVSFSIFELSYTPSVLFYLSHFSSKNKLAGDKYSRMDGVHDYVFINLCVCWMVGQLILLGQTTDN
jgi:hypothetical protein